MRQLLSRSRPSDGRITRELKITRRDEARTVAKRFLNQNLEPVALLTPDGPIQTVTAACFKLYAQKGNGVAIIHATIRGVHPITANRDTQQRGVRRVEESGQPRPQRRPYITIRIDRAQHDERQLRKKETVLIDKMAADYPRPYHTHAIGDARKPMHMHFASVPWSEHILIIRM